jgi:chloramphenicol-sensitive protein RarD
MSLAELRAPSVQIDPPRGLAYALGAYVIWGCLPLYLKLMQHIPVMELLAHRIIWSIPVAGAILCWQGRTSDLVAALRNPRMLAMAAVTATLISLNWAIYLWAIASHQAMDAALGYYMNPLFSIFLGAMVLGERLRRAQWLAIGLATLGVIVLTCENGRLPLVALGLMLTFGLYGYAKKRLPIGPNQGFMLEAMLLAPPALIWLIWTEISGQSHFIVTGAGDTALLLGAGVVTAVPLILYGNGAKLLRMTTNGILQFLSPTLIFIMAIVLFDEPFGRGEMLAFPMIWLALAIYVAAMLRQQFKRPGHAAPA